jgi:hypothetical protein
MGRLLIEETQDEAISPLVREATGNKSEIYGFITEFLSGKSDRFKFQHKLRNSGVSQNAIYDALFQSLIEESLQHGQVTFAKMRNAITTAIAKEPILAKEEPVVTVMKKLELTQVPQSCPVTARGQSARSFYAPLPMKPGWNKMFEAKTKEMEIVYSARAKRMQRSAKTQKHIPNRLISILPKSFLERISRDA